MIVLSLQFSPQQPMETSACQEKPTNKRMRFGGFLVRRERWALSRRGWALMLVILVAFFCGVTRGVHPFLTVNTGGSGEVLVVEGWISGRKIDEAVRAFHDGNYQCVVVQGVFDEGNKWESGRYKAHYVAADLVRQGVPEDRIHTLFWLLF